MSKLNVTNPAKGIAQVLGRNRALESRMLPARAARGAVAAPDATRGLVDPFSTVQKVKARKPQKSMRELLDERARIYSQFCKSRR